MGCTSSVEPAGANPIRPKGFAAKTPEKKNVHPVHPARTSKAKSDNPIIVVPDKDNDIEIHPVSVTESSESVSGVPPSTEVASTVLTAEPISFQIHDHCGDKTVHRVVDEKNVHTWLFSSLVLVKNIQAAKVTFPDKRMDQFIPAFDEVCLAFKTLDELIPPSLRVDTSSKDNLDSSIGTLSASGGSSWNKRSKSPGVFTKSPTGRVISARSCAACGRDDRSGVQQEDGFRCYECVGLAANKAFVTQIQVAHHAVKGKDDFKHKMINQYVIIGKLGSGTYANVKLAVHQISNQVYALKEFDRVKLKKIRRSWNPDGTDVKTAMDDVMREITILKNLQHNSLTSLYEVIDDHSSDKLYLVLEYCARGILLEINNKGQSNRTIPIPTIKKYTMGIARALHYLHSRNIVHRDIKPQNILLDAYDNIKVSDFGVSAQTIFHAEEKVTAEGSPAFMSPESLADEGTCGPPSDIWAFGVTLYCMVFNKLPYHEDTLSHLKKAIRDNPLPDLDHEDDELTDLLERMLEKVPSKRATIQQVLEHPWLCEVPIINGQPKEPDMCHDAEEHEEHEHHEESTIEALKMAALASKAQARHLDESFMGSIPSVAESSHGHAHSAPKSTKGSPTDCAYEEFCQEKHR